MTQERRQTPHTPPSTRKAVVTSTARKPAKHNMDLSIIDQAYGPDADLYVHVLRASCLASPEEIQVAFFDRRSELFDILSKLNQDEDEIALSQRMFAERRMDAVVLAFRILKDPRTRLQYHKLREDRLMRRANILPQRPTNKQKLTTAGDPVLSKASISPISVKSSSSSSKLLTQSKTVTQSSNPITKPSKQAASSKAAIKTNKQATPSKTVTTNSSKQTATSQQPDRHISAGSLNQPWATVQKSNKPLTSSRAVTRGRSHTQRAIVDDATSDGDTLFTTDTSYTSALSTDDETMDYTDDDYSMVSRDVSLVDRFQRRSKGGGVLRALTQSTYVCKCAEEIKGTLSDSCNAFDQVFNVFTLQEKDINAVCARIEKAKKTLHTFK